MELEGVELLIYGTGSLQTSGVSNTLLRTLSNSLSVQRPKLPESIAPLTVERSTVRDLARQVLNLRQAVDSVRFGARLTSTGSAAAVSPGSKFVHADKFPGVVKEFGEILQTLFSSEFSPYALGSADRTLRRIESAIRDAFSSIQDDTSGDRFQSGLGIDFDFRDGARFLVLDTTRLTLALSRDPEGLAEFLLSDAGSGGNEGLLVVVERALEEPGDDLALRFDPVAKRGLIVNLTA